MIDSRIWTASQRSRPSAGIFKLQVNPQLTNVAGLSNVTSIDRSLKILVNGQLASLNGLASLTTVGGGLDGIEINGNVSLTNLDGLSGLTSAGSSLSGITLLWRTWTASRASRLPVADYLILFGNEQLDERGRPLGNHVYR